MVAATIARVGATVLPLLEPPLRQEPTATTITTTTTAAITMRTGSTYAQTNISTSIDATEVQGGGLLSAVLPCFLVGLQGAN
jgi:hypothetical protein